jgi:hypothetical protein
VISQRPAREKHYGWWRKYNGFWDHPKWQGPPCTSRSQGVAVTASPENFARRVLTHRGRGQGF